MSLVSHESVAVIMTNEEARECVERIRAGIDGVRAEVLRLHEGDGWKSLGYESWRECVTVEFEQSQAYLYRLLSAAQIEREIAPISQNASHEATVSPIGETVAIPESVLRPLKPLLGDPDTMRRVWNEVVDEHGENITAAKVAAKVAEIAPPKMTPGERDTQEALARMAESQRARDEGRLPLPFADTTGIMDDPKLARLTKAQENAVATAELARIYKETDPVHRAMEYLNKATMIEAAEYVKRLGGLNAIDVFLENDVKIAEAGQEWLRQYAAALRKKLGIEDQQMRRVK